MVHALEIEHRLRKRRMDVPVPRILGESFCAVTFEDPVEIGSASLAKKVSVVRRRADANSTSCSCKRVAQIVRQVLELVCSKLILVLENDVMRRF